MLTKKLFFVSVLMRQPTQKTYNSPTGLKEEVMKEKKWCFEPSVLYQKEVLENEVRYAPWGCFEKRPFFEVRKACLKKISDYGLSDEWHADWAEYFIQELNESEKHEDNVLLDDLLSLYIFKSSDDLAVRAIEFAILFEDKVCSKMNLISKLVTGRIKDNPQLYSKIPSLKKFLHKLLDLMIRRKEWADREYMESDWFAVERVRGMIMRNKDRSFLPKINKLISMLESGDIVPWRFSPEETLHMNLARLHFTREILLKAKKEVKQAKAKSFLEKSAIDLTGSFFLSSA